MTKQGLFKRIKMYFWYKAKIIKEMDRINKLLDKKILEQASKLKELDQHKTYYILVPDVEAEEANRLMDFINEARKKIPWTVPMILLFNKELKETTLEELKKKLKK